MVTETPSPSVADPVTYQLRHKTQRFRYVRIPTKTPRGLELPPAFKLFEASLCFGVEW